MGTSYIKYNDRGFWTPDSDIEVWLYLFSLEIDTLPEKPDWLLKLKETVHFYATAGFVGCINPDLNGLINTPEKKDIAFEISQKVLNRLRHFGETIPLTTINSWGFGGPQSKYVKEPPVQKFIETGEQFISLLK